MAATPQIEILDFALSLAEEAGRLILPLWNHVTVQQKPDGSEVTEADRKAEELLRSRIAQRFPDHAILGEEFGGDAIRDAEDLWVLDPIDGTASFAIGLPLFGTLIGYVRRGEPSVGVVAAHALGETIWAATGQGCWLRRGGAAPERVHTLRVSDPSEAFAVATAFEHIDMDLRQPEPSFGLSRLYRKVCCFRWLGDCINYGFLCRGCIDIALDLVMNP